MVATVLALLARVPFLGSVIAAVTGGGFAAQATRLAAAAVEFFSTRLGQCIGIALIGVALFTWGDVRRHRIDAAEHRAEIARLKADAEQRRKERDEEIRVQVSRDAAARLAAIEKSATELQRKVKSYEAQLAKRDACRLDSRDADRLRRL